MKFLKVIVGLLLVVSLGVNVIMYTKYRNTRPIIKLNGQGISRLDLVSFLEGQAGPAVKAQLVERRLIEQEAAKKGVLPTDEEVEEAYNREKELNSRMAQEVAVNPWLAGERRWQIKLLLARNRLLTKDIPVSEEEIKEEYNSRKPFYDTPTKARTELAFILDPSVTDDVKELLSKQPSVNPRVIMQQLSPKKVRFEGDNNVFVFVQPYGTQQNREIMTMKPNEVRVLNPPPNMARAGVRALVVRMIEVIPGKPADLNDPKTKERIRMNVAARRAKPWKEMLADIWANTEFWSEDPADKRLVEYILFPEKAAVADEARK